jgi:hypothetical protein
MNYYSVCVYGTDTDGSRVAGCHIIKATSDEHALEIRERHGISNPRFAKGDIRITCREVNLDFEVDGRFVNQELIERRKLGIGGIIWHEDKNKQLQKDI